MNQAKLIDRLGRTDNSYNARVSTAWIICRAHNWYMLGNIPWEIARDLGPEKLTSFDLARNAIKTAIRQRVFNRIEHQLLKHHV